MKHEKLYDRLMRIGMILLLVLALILICSPRFQPDTTRPWSKDSGQAAGGPAVQDSEQALLESDGRFWGENGQLAQLWRQYRRQDQGARQNNTEQEAVQGSREHSVPGQEKAQEELELLRLEYEAYEKRLDAVHTVSDIRANGFEVIESQVFPILMEYAGEVSFLPAMDTEYSRLVLLIADENQQIIYKTDQLETNNRYQGRLEQPNQGIAAVSFQDMNGDALIDIVLITTCMNETGEYAGRPYKVGDVLFQEEQGFYRDYRLSDKINRFSMNKSVDFIAAFVRDGYSTEFLYTAATLDELLDQRFEIIAEQCYWRQFEKLGRLQVVPGTYKIANYDIFMIYMINEQGYIIWSCQPMGDYDNLYALKGINCRDIDGDGLKDMVVLARYSYEDMLGALAVESDYQIYYQRTGGFTADTEYKQQYQCSDEDTVEELIKKARAYWGWQIEP